MSPQDAVSPGDRPGPDQVTQAVRDARAPVTWAEIARLAAVLGRPDIRDAALDMAARALPPSRLWSAPPTVARRSDLEMRTTAD